MFIMCAEGYKKTFIKYCRAEIRTSILVSFEPSHVVFVRRNRIRCIITYKVMSLSLIWEVNL